jgi:hypothetical protein
VTGWLLTVLGVLGAFGMTALGDMLSEEVRDRLDHLPHAILRMAAHWLGATQRITVYEDEWLPELSYILKGDEARPVTRLVHGTMFAIGILLNAALLAHTLHRPIRKERQSLSEPVLLSSTGESPNIGVNLATRFCTKCGSQLENADIFCGMCGSAVRQSQ